MTKAKLEREKFKKEFIENNPSYDFSQYDWTLNYEEKSIIICPDHGIQYKSLRSLKESGCCNICNKAKHKTTRETTESYINKMNTKFPNHKLDFTNFSYPTHQHERIKFFCKEHGEFEATPNATLFKDIDPCRICSEEIRGVADIIKDKESFINKAVKKYGDKYSYDKIEYTTSVNLVENIFCNTHKSYFNCIAGNFIHTAKIGCPKCIEDKAKQKVYDRQDDFINKCIDKHGTEKYDFSKIKYTGGKEHIEVTCNTCNTTFYPVASNFAYNGTGCPICANRLFYKDSPTSLYILEIKGVLETPIYKVGVSSNLSRRFRCEFKEEYSYTFIFQREFKDSYYPSLLEQQILYEYSDYKYIGESPFRSTGISEIITVYPSKILDNIK